MVSFYWNPFGSTSSAPTSSSTPSPSSAPLQSPQTITQAISTVPSTTTPTEIQNPPANDTRPAHYLTDLSPFARARRQLTLFAAGSVFLLLSTRLARKSLHKRYLSTCPPFYTPNNRPIAPFNGGVDAFEALSIASIAVASVGMVQVGGWMWALDVVNVEELRVWTRLRFGGEQRKSEKEVEEELEEWIATILARKDRKKMSDQETGRER